MFVTAGAGSSTELPGLEDISISAAKGSLSGGGVVAGKDKGVGGSGLCIASDLSDGDESARESISVRKQVEWYVFIRCS